MPNYRALATAAARRYGIDPRIFLRQIGQESGFNPNAHSPAGAQGIAQFMPATARGMGVNPRDPRSSLFGAARMDAQNLKKYGGSWQDVLSAYNSGRPWAHGRGIAETRNYVRSILGGGGATQATAPGPAPALAPPSQPSDASRSTLLQSLISASQQTHGGHTPDLTPALLALKGMSQNAPQSAPPDATDPSQVRFSVSGPVTPRAKAAVRLASEFLGTPYKWGGAAPGGFDCSGLVQYVYAKSGVHVPRTTYDQWKSGTPVGRGQLQAGDVVFFEPSARGPGHEGLYIGGGRFIEAPHTGASVRISTLAGRRDYVGGRRLG